MFELKKAGFFKRASALLLDAILLAVLSTGFMWILDLICHCSGAWKSANLDYTAWEEFREAYAKDIADTYGFNYVAGEDGRSYTLTQVIDGQEQAVPFKTMTNALEDDENRSERMEEAYTAFKKLTPEEEVDKEYRYAFLLLMVVISIGILLSYLILEFILPIILKNGQTVGKKVFSLCLVRSNCVKISVLSLFARTLIGKYAIETMFPIMLIFLFLFGGLGVVAIIVFAALVLLNIILFFVTKNRLPIHDAIAGTVVVDKSTQMIFQSEEELAEKKAQQKDFFNNSNSGK